MEITVERENDVVVVIIPVTELDAANVAEFKRDIDPILDAHAKIVIDLSKLHFIDSSGLGAFLSCMRKLNERQGNLKLCGMSKQVLASFELVRLHRILDVFASREEAIRAFHA